MLQTFELNDRQQIDLFLYSLRYAMGRRTAAPSDVADHIAAHWAKLCPQAKQLILRDLKEAIDRDDLGREMGVSYNSLGDDCDRETWDSLLEKLEKFENEQKSDSGDAG